MYLCYCIFVIEIIIIFSLVKVKKMMNIKKLKVKKKYIRLSICILFIII